MRVERRGACGGKVVGREKLFKLRAFPRPFDWRWFGEYLRNPAPAYVANEDTFLFFCRRATFRLQSLRKLDRREVFAAFLFERSVSEPVFGPNAIVRSV